MIQEVLSSIRVVKAFAREDYEQRRLEEESLESVEIALRARGLKAKLAPLVEIIVAVGTSLVLWFGARMVLERQPFGRARWWSSSSISARCTSRCRNSRR